MSLEIWKGMHMLGIWELSAEQAWDLSAELIAHMPEAPPSIRAGDPNVTDEQWEAHVEELRTDTPTEGGENEND